MHRDSFTSHSSSFAEYAKGPSAKRGLFLSVPLLHSSGTSRLPPAHSGFFGIGVLHSPYRPQNAPASHASARTDPGAEFRCLGSLPVPVVCDWYETVIGGHVSRLQNQRFLPSPPGQCRQQHSLAGLQCRPHIQITLHTFAPFHDFNGRILYAMRHLQKGSGAFRILQDFLALFLRPWAVRPLHKAHLRSRPAAYPGQSRPRWNMG